MADRMTDGFITVRWVTTLSSTTSPTAVQINAGVDLTSFVTKDGLDISPDQNMVDTTALNSLTETQGLGMAKVDISLTMKSQDPTDTAWTTFAGNPAGYLVVRRTLAVATAIAAGQKVEVYPVVASNRMKNKPAANEVQKFTVKLPLTSDYTAEATVA